MQLRRAGLVDRLLDSGVDVEDGGDLPLALYRPGSKDPRAQNLDQVIMVAQRVADRVEQVAAEGRLPLVVGGDCTITLGVVAGLLRGHPDLGLLYFDGDIDLGTPATSLSGILDSMGVAHLLGDGAPTLARIGPRHPMLSADRLVLIGYDEADLDDAEELDRRGLQTWPVERIVGRTTEAANEALAALDRADPILVHFDVDAIDSTDYPLANFPHFNVGQTFDSAMACLEGLCKTPKLGGLVLTEVNPDHDADGSLIARLVDGVVTALRTTESSGP